MAVADSDGPLLPCISKGLSNVILPAALAADGEVQCPQLLLLLVMCPCALWPCAGEVEPTVPGSVVELVSRLVAGKAGPAAGTGAAGERQQQPQQQARAEGGGGPFAAAAGLTPLLPGLTALAASTSDERQYGEWLLLALESAGMSAGEEW